MYERIKYIEINMIQDKIVKFVYLMIIIYNSYQDFNEKIIKLTLQTFEKKKFDILDI